MWKEGLPIFKGLREYKPYCASITNIQSILMLGGSEDMPPG